MLVKLKTIVESEAAINAFSALPLKANVSFRYRRVIKDLREHIKDYNDNRLEVLKKLGTESKEHPGAYQLGDNLEAANRELTDLLYEEVELADTKIPLSVFAKSNGPITDDTEWFEFSSDHFAALDYLIEDTNGDTSNITDIESEK